MPTLTYQWTPLFSSGFSVFVHCVRHLSPWNSHRQPPLLFSGGWKYSQVSSPASRVVIPVCQAIPHSASWSSQVSVTLHTLNKKSWKIFSWKKHWNPWPTACTCPHSVPMDHVPTMQVKQPKEDLPGKSSGISGMDWNGLDPNFWDAKCHLNIFPKAGHPKNQQLYLSKETLLRD